MVQAIRKAALAGAMQAHWSRTAFRLKAMELLVPTECVHMDVLHRRPDGAQQMDTWFVNAPGGLTLADRGGRGGGAPG